MKFYLAGSIFIEKDKGAGWRDEITPKIEALGHSVMNPLHKPDEANSIPTINEMKRTGNLGGMLYFCRQKIIKPDMMMIGDSNAILAVYKIDEHGVINWSFGTTCEVWEGYRRGLPIYVIIPGMTEDQYIKQVGAFLLGITGSIVRSFDDFLMDLDLFNKAQKAIDDANKRAYDRD